MEIPTKNELNMLRKKGFRPQVVGCFLHDKKILFLYKKEYDLWQFPQGGIDNNERVADAFWREMKEELGQNNINDNDDIKIFGKDIIVFPKDAKGSRDLYTDEGEEIFMQGKFYFFILTKIQNEKITIADTEFDDYKWLSYEQAVQFAQNIYQKGKKRMTLNILNILNNNKIL